MLQALTPPHAATIVGAHVYIVHEATLHIRVRVHARTRRHPTRPAIPRHSAGVCL